MLTDAEYIAWKTIPDLTGKLEDDDVYSLRGISEIWFSGDEYQGHLAWKRALVHANQLNEEYYQNDIAFRVVKFCQDYYVIEKNSAEQKYGLDLSSALPIL